MKLEAYREHVRRIYDEVGSGSGLEVPSELPRPLRVGQVRLLEGMLGGDRGGEGKGEGNGLVHSALAQGEGEGMEKVGGLECEGRGRMWGEEERGVIGRRTGSRTAARLELDRPAGSDDVSLWEKVHMFEQE